MERTNHVLLIGQGANLFAQEMGIPELYPLELVSPTAQGRYKQFKQSSKVVSDIFNDKRVSTDSASDSKGIDGVEHDTVGAVAMDLKGSLAAGDFKSVDGVEHDTVGAVAMDLKGSLAAGTSTGGITLKRVGRVGDSPLVGSGAYCDNESGGVSCTGHGESIAKVLLAQHALTRLQMTGDCSSSSSGERVLGESLDYMLQRVGGRGGMIMVTKDGAIAKSYSTKCMSWASINKNGELESGL